MDSEIWTPQPYQLFVGLLGEIHRLFRWLLIWSVVVYWNFVHCYILTQKIRPKSAKQSLEPCFCSISLTNFTVCQNNFAHIFDDLIWHLHVRLKIRLLPSSSTGNWQRVWDMPKTGKLTNYSRHTWNTNWYKILLIFLFQNI